MSIRTFETLNKITRLSIPDTNALIKRTGSDELGIGRNGNSCDTILDAKSESALASFNVPKTNGAITTTRCNETSIPCKVKRVDVLLVTSKSITDGSGGNIPNLDQSAHVAGIEVHTTYSDQFILGTSCKISSVRTEANTSDVKISY